MDTNGSATTSHSEKIQSSSSNLSLMEQSLADTERIMREADQMESDLWREARARWRAKAQQDKKD